MTMRTTCGDCVFWTDPTKDRRYGDCLKRVPMAMPLDPRERKMDPGAPMWSTTWPVTASDDWCAEFHPRSCSDCGRLLGPEKK